MTMMKRICVKQRFLGVDGGLTYVQGVNGYVNCYDENGYIKSRSYIDARGNAAYFSEEADDEINRLLILNWSLSMMYMVIRWMSRF